MANNNAHAFIIESIKPENSLKESISLIQNKICGKNDGCQKCMSLEKQTNPNLVQINGYEEKIKIEHVESVKDLCSTTSLNTDPKIILIQGIENITPKAANTFLKFIEEPDSDIMFVFTTTNANSVLETIQTRCQIIRVKNTGTNIFTENTNLLLSSKPFEISWNTLSKEEIKNTMVLFTQEVKVQKNEILLKKILKLINMLNSNVNINLIVSQIIEATKTRTNNV